MEQERVGDFFGETHVNKYRRIQKNYDGVIKVKYNHIFSLEFGVVYTTPLSLVREAVHSFTRVQSTSLIINMYYTKAQPLRFFPYF
jgi:hypothetical protein